MQVTPRKCTEQTYTVNDLSGDPKLDGKVMQRTTQEGWELIGEKQGRIGIDGGEQMGRRLFKEEDDEEEEEE